MTEVVLIDAVVKSFANAGKTYGKTLTVLTSAFALALEHKLDANTIDAYQHTFYLNGARSSLGLTEARANLVVIGSKNGGLSPFDFKSPETMGDKNRTHDEQRVFDALKSAFSTARKVAGFPMKPIAPRAPRATQGKASPVTGNAQSVDDSQRIIGCTADALGVASEIVAELRTLANAKTLTGDAGMLLRDAIKAFGVAVKAAKKADLEKDAPKILIAA